MKTLLYQQQNDCFVNDTAELMIFTAFHKHLSSLFKVIDGVISALEVQVHMDAVYEPAENGSIESLMQGIGREDV